MPKVHFLDELRVFLTFVAISTEIERDDDARWQKEWGEKNGSKAWCTDIIGRTVVLGEFFEHRSCMSGTWSKMRNPDADKFAREELDEYVTYDLVEELLDELKAAIVKRFPNYGEHVVLTEIDRTLEYIKQCKRGER